MTFLVTVDIPIVLPQSGAPSSLFTYQIHTSNWAEGLAPSDPGASISATASVPPPAPGQPPTVSITTPAKGAIFEYNFGAVPPTIPLAFNVIGDGPITSVDATVTGPTGSGVELAVTATGLNAGTAAQGVANIPIPQAGTYTVTANGRTNIGSASDSSTFTIRILGAPAPTVTIATPRPGSDYTYFVGGPAVDVPVAFSAETPSGTTLKQWSATLARDGDASAPVVLTPQTPTGNSQSGTATLNLLTITGHYSLVVTARNEYTEANASTDFYINRVTNPNDVTIDAFQNAAFAVEATGHGTYTYSWYRQPSGTTGFVPISDSSVFSGTATKTLSITGGTAPMSGDKYQCRITGSSGYVVDSAPALLTVRKLNPVITWNGSVIVYGTPLSSAQLNATASVAGTLTYSPTSGTFAAGIQTLNVTLQPTDSDNYNPASKSVVLVINKAPITVTAANQTREYGSSDLLLTYSITSGALVGSDTLTGTVVRAAGENVGTYAITQGTVAASSNYALTFVAGNFEITRAELTVTANNQTRNYGVANPTFDASYSGFKLNDTKAVLTGAPALTTAAALTSPAGTYPIVAAQGNLASPNYTFVFVNGTLTITSSGQASISGTVFFDANTNIVRNADEPGIGGVTVKLYKKTSLVEVSYVTQTTTTAAGPGVPSSAVGSYTFGNVEPGVYEIDALEPVGLTPTNAAALVVTITSTPKTDADIGLGLNLGAIAGMKANGFTIGYWKNNIDKAIGNKGGYQVSPTAIASYTTAIQGYALTPFANLTRELASGYLGSTSSDPAMLLQKQLVGSEYNLANGALLNGNRSLTDLFIYWGEYVLSHSTEFSSTYIIWAKDWFDAYNNTHGGVVAGPAPLGSTSLAATFNSTSLAKDTYLWFNAVVNVGGRGGKAAVVECNRASVLLTISGYPITVDIPSAVITFDPTVTIATSTYDDGNDTWRTTVPASFTGDVFMSGMAIKLPVNLPGNIPVTWSNRFVSATPGLSAQWAWSAAVYKQFNDTDPDLLGVKSIDGSKLNVYANADNGGTPELFKSYVTAGARGGGGSNFTGSYSSTLTASVAQP